MKDIWIYIVEYGMGGAVSTEGDVYSYGILLLELFTGRRPTDESFKDNFNLHNFVRLSLPDQVMEIVDQSALQEEVVQAAAAKTSGSRCDITECLISLFEIGVACSAESPQDRMNMRQVSRELISIEDKYLGTQY